MDLASHGVVAVIIDKKGRFLLLREAREGDMHSLWAPAHGTCEVTDKSEKACLVREVQEETGLVVRPINVLLTQVADTKSKTVSFWLCEMTSPAAKINLNEEASSYGWYSLDEALSLELYPGTKIFFEKLKSGEIGLKS